MTTYELVALLDKFQSQLSELENEEQRHKDEKTKRIVSNGRLGNLAFNVSLTLGSLLTMGALPPAVIVTLLASGKSMYDVIAITDDYFETRWRNTEIRKLQSSQKELRAQLAQIEAALDFKRE